MKTKLQSKGIVKAVAQKGKGKKAGKKQKGSVTAKQSFHSAYKKYKKSAMHSPHAGHETMHKSTACKRR